MDYARLADEGVDAVSRALSGAAAGIAARTSGSTGEPREVLLSSQAMTASAKATLERLGGPGHWLLALPADRIAGAMVAARAHVGRTTLIAPDLTPFTAHGFATATASMPTGRRYVSLVPTQMRRLLDDPEGAAAFATFDAVLVGGAPPGLDLPSNAVETYGMTETSGGCVYDGVPLAGVDIHIAADGRIELSGPMLADGFADGDNSVFVEHGGKRWLRTSDLGEWDGARLTVLGRADDVMIVGGHNVHPATVEHALLASANIADALVTSVPDVEWGEKIVALVALAPGTNLDLAQLTSRLDLEPHAIPRDVITVGHVPRTDAGKIDRVAAREYAIRADR